MDAQILTVHWHDGEQPVYSAHYQPAAKGASDRLATGGGDNNVRLWRLVRSEGQAKVEYLSTLAKHTQAVNVVRFDSKGELLATAGDDGCAMIWHKAEGIVREFGAEPDDEALESWNMKTLCRSSSSEIYDLAWSPDSRFIITGSTDNVARVYDVSTGQQVAQLNEHGHYVQGVAWDPRGKFLATQSADRSVHVHGLKSCEKEFKAAVLQKSSRAELPTRQAPESTTITSTSPEQPESEQTPTKHTTMKASMLYHTESLRSFFRRLTFSPDGNFLLAPAGVFKNTQEQDKDETLNTVYIYTRQGLNKPPIAHLPGFKKPALVVAFSPVVYELDKQVQGAFQLPYKMVYAVATVDAVHVFDTQSEEALGSVSSIHYGTLTDLAWNNDGQSLLVSSADGFCTTLQFSPEALGTPLAVDYKTLLPEDVVDERLNTPKSAKKRPVPTQQPPSSIHSSTITQSPSTTIPSSPLAGPLDSFAKKTKAAPVASPLQRPAPVMNTINHLIKKKKVSPTPVTNSTTTTTVTVPVAETISILDDVVMIDAKDEHTVITIDDEPPKPVKEKKRISPTLVSEPYAN